MTVDRRRGQSEARRGPGETRPRAARRRAGDDHAGPPQLNLLGSWSLRVGSSSLSLGWSAQRLLVLLALRGAQHRTFLAGTLWPDTTDDQALMRLRSTLWRLRRQTSGLIEADEHTVALSPTTEVDVDRLRRACRNLIDEGQEPSQLTALFKTLVQARELLPGWYDDWVLQERQRLTDLRIHALDLLVDALLAVKRHAEAVEAAIAAEQLDPLRESTHRAVMRAYLAEGNPASALRELERYRALLRSEFGIDQPTPLMLELIGNQPGARPGAVLRAPFDAQDAALAPGEPAG